MSEQADRLERAFMDYDGDACRPETGISADQIAEAVLISHTDIATCFCPLCVLARAYREMAVREPTRVEQAFRKLLDALDRQHSSIPFSANVEQARTEARLLNPVKATPPDPDDVAGGG